MRKVLLASTIALLGLTGTAKAHFKLVSPPSVIASDPNGKGPPPCGPDTGAAATPTAVQGGHALNLMINETVPHDGFYRVALALKSRSEFPPDNKVYDKNGMVLLPDGSNRGTSFRADHEDPAVFPVLADDLFDHVGTGAMTFPNAAHPGTVMVPNLNCDRCILQVIEFMNGHGYNNPDGTNNGGYFYHHCAEIKITADPSMPLFVPPGADGGAPDASPTDAKADSSPAGAGGNGGAAGTTGSAGAGGGGTTGAGGSGMGAAGTSGAGGTTGSAGNAGTAGVAGAAGATGTAGTTGVAGSTAPHQSSGGCSYGNGTPKAPFAVAGAAIALMVALTRRRRR